MEKKIIQEIHRLQIGMIRQLHEVCMENGIRYTVLCGSLLGAVRHKGFIPWDDDMDIALLRDDYEKLLRVLKEKPIAGCFLQDHSTDPHYCQPYAKLLKEDTVYVERFQEKCKCRNGIFIDIFPLDQIEAPGKRTVEFRRILSRFVTFAVWHKENCHMERQGMKKAINGIAAVMSILPKRTLLGIQRSLVVRPHPEWTYAASMFSSNYHTGKLYFHTSDFDNLIQLPFEDTVVNAPANWEENLTRLYKNYKQLPPEDKRNSGHDVIRVELG